MTQEKITGWDFSYLGKRMTESRLPWDYEKKIRYFISENDNLLDLGTGGGEFLSTLADLNINIFATEGYEPNFEIAKKRLNEFNATLITDFKDNNLPFENDFFDIVINRHESYDSKEVCRILKKEGYFITQQADPESDLNLNRLLGIKPNDEYSHWNLNYAVNDLKICGFKILETVKDSGYTRFTDPDSVVFYMKSIPWQFKNPDDIDYEIVKKKLDNFIFENEHFDSDKKRFLIVAQK